MSRVSLRSTAAGAVAALLLTGCGGAPAAPPAETPAGGAFPVIVEHSLGSTTIEQEPLRVATLGNRDADVVLALGVVPVAIGTYYDYERGVGPWAEDALGDATPTVLRLRELDYEALAVAAPDLILDVSSEGDRTQYDRLSRIAPTISVPVGAQPFTAPWRDVTRLVAQALGRSDDGDRLVRETEEYLASVASAHPAFAGRTITYLDLFGADVYVGGRDSSMIGTMRDVGFVAAPYVEAGLTGSQNQISQELLPQVDADVIVAYSIGSSAEEATAAVPALGRLTGRLHFLPDLALSAPSVLSIPFAVDRLLPVLQEATAT